MEPYPRAELVVPDTPSDTSNSPERKRTKVIHMQRTPFKNGKSNVYFRSPGSITTNDQERVKASSSSIHCTGNTPNSCPQANVISRNTVLVDESVKGALSVPKAARCTGGRSRLPSMKTRTTTAAFHDALLRLNSAQNDAVRDIGFGNILELKAKELPGRLGYWALNKFNPVSRILEINNSCRVTITTDDVYRVFGIPKGVQKIRTFERQSNSELFEKWFEFFKVDKRDKIKIGVVLTVMLNCKNGGTWFKRHFMVAMAFALFESCPNGTVHPFILNTLYDMDTLDKWDWGDYVLKSLIQHRKTWGGDESKMYTGPLLFLVLFYVDRFNIDGAIPKRIFPIMMNWYSSDLRERQRLEMNQPSFGVGSLREPLELPARYMVRTIDPATINDKADDGGVEEFVVSKQLRDDARYIADKMAALRKLANSATLRERQTKIFKDSVEEASLLTGMRIAVDIPVSEHPTPVIVDIEDDIEYPDEFLTWVDTVSAAALPKKRSLNIKKDDIPSFDLSISDDDFVVYDEIAVSYHSSPTPVKKKVIEPSVNNQMLSTKENTCYHTPLKPVVRFENRRHALQPLDLNARVLTDDVPGGDSPILGCVKKGLLTKRLHYQTTDVVNTVCTRTELSNIEKAIALHCIYDDVADDDQELFLFKGIELRRYDMISLKRGTLVQPAIINAWSAILNHSEKSCYAKYPTRFFASTDIYIEYLDVSDKSYEEQQKAFSLAFSQELRLYQSKLIGLIDIFVIPVFADEYPYLMCVDARKGLIFILDNSFTTNDNQAEGRYNILCGIFRNMLSAFLYDQSEDVMALSVANAAIRVVDIECPDGRNFIESAIYLMRIMEVFKGDTSPNWKRELLDANPRQLCKMRIRYCATIVGWELNVVKDEVLKHSSDTYGVLLEEDSSKFDYLFTCS